MSYSVKPASIFGRIGTEVGKGLAEQLPKEFEHQRLNQGLQDLAKNSGNLSPEEFLAKAAGTYGISPEMIRQFGELAKNRRMRSSFAGKQEKGENFNEIGSPNTMEQAKNIKFGGNALNQSNRIGKDSVNAIMDKGQPLEENQVNPNNPTNPEFQTKYRWSPQRVEREISDYWSKHPELEFNQVQAYVNDKETRELSQPDVAQKEYQRLENNKIDMNDKFLNKLSQKLQKKPSEKGVVSQEVYQDISGENISAMQRAMEEELVNNPNLSVDDVVDRWTTKALDLAKTKDQLKKLENKDLWFIRPSKAGEMRQKLEEYSDIFRDAGNSEEFYNHLQEKFKMTPQGSASIAFKPSENLSKYLKSIKFTPVDSENQISNARKYAMDIGKIINDEDSILTAARNIYERDPLFNQSEFFHQLSEMKDRLGLNERQKREIAEGAQLNLRPSWGDFWITGKVR